jgi:hypothetical protein
MSRLYRLTKQETKFSITFRIRSKDEQLNNTERVFQSFWTALPKWKNAEWLKEGLEKAAPSAVGIRGGKNRQ